MCGITGYWVRRGDPSPWLADMGQAVASLRRRGPDDSGTWVRPGGRVALGHTRLSILDLSPLGHQPMHSHDGSIAMVFNGEVYNFAAIRSELEALGHRFRSSGDSEVVLAALWQWGVAAVERFIGMFAIALWDERTRRLLLLRDGRISQLTKDHVDETIAALSNLLDEVGAAQAVLAGEQVHG